MEYIVRVWLMKDRVPTTEYVEMDDLDDAQAYAARRVYEARKDGLEFDVIIYERTNF
ncbi:MAG: hypothetical protein IJM76_05755 [Lachnospiraceae bacterium]|nr:hypothetical protein [Lachnospiraceae bacterium]